MQDGSIKSGDKLLAVEDKPVMGYTVDRVRAASAAILDPHPIPGLMYIG